MDTGTQNNIISGDHFMNIVSGYNPSSEPNMQRNSFTEEGYIKPVNLYKYRLSNIIDISQRENEKDNQKRSPRPLLNKEISLSTHHKENLSPVVTTMDWNNYHRLNVIHHFLDDLESTYPSLCSVGVVGCSNEGRDLKIIKISNSDSDNCSVWIDAGVHAREWIGPAVNTYIANYIATNFKTLPKYVTNKDWYFLPVANPDGYEYSHTVDRMWRKNKACINGRCVGVDLNRNFSFAWGGNGSSAVPSHNFFRGRQPFSEPESSAIRDVLSNDSLAFKVYITLHSYGQVIIFPFACTDNLCPGYIRLLEGATIMSKSIYQTSGRIYKVGISKDVMYRASGTSNDWSHAVVGIPYCYLIELRSRKHRFKLPSAEIEETGNEILNCVFALMEFVDSYPKEKLVAENEKFINMKF
ncbi:carboxypeptidase B-like isoform X1 [Hyposmocoma kahamanoa]|uniref:carboxypeptidase B-like isoform X1 n=1 Tax=Hyposmocoma kahamanoa TaxID=1477025 RepID=UPI000E6D98A2|nr:carboxypeptidase B-like isoform X1 [Hyposmocoma kahamanoa]